MSRSGYVDEVDCDWTSIRWRGAVASAIRGQRGQDLLRALRTSLDSMPKKRLIHGEFVDSSGDVCVLGALAQHCHIDVSGIDADEGDEVAAAFNIAPALAREIGYENDEFFRAESPEDRWGRMRRWVDNQIIKVVESGEGETEEVTE